MVCTEQQLVEAAREAVATVAVDTFNRRYGLFAAACESPIERVLLAAMVGFMNQDAGGPVFFSPRPFDHDKPPSQYIGPIMAFPQSAIGPYRVDFLFVVFAGERKAQTIARMVVVECDGHEYHERTKAQAERDRARDRWMLERNVQVLRFTGSEIWRDPASCVEQIYRVVIGLPVEEAA